MQFAPWFFHTHWEHAKWQGKIYSRSGNDPNYPDFKKSTGYGTGTGLCGWNCRHTFGPYIEGSPPVWSEEQLAELDKPKYEYGGRKLTEYEASQQQRYNERQIRRWKREYVAMETAGLDTSEVSAKIKQWQAVQREFLSQTGLKQQSGREQTFGFGRAQTSAAAAEAKRIENAANSIFSLGSTDKNVRAYLKEKTTIDMLSQHGVKYIKRVSADEIIVDAGSPEITGMRTHAVQNLLYKSDRKEMTLEQAQAFVNQARLTLYYPSNETLKFYANDGYAVLNFKHELVTAVPQKWRKKLNQYVKEEFQP